MSLSTVLMRCPCGEVTRWAQANDAQRLAYGLNHATTCEALSPASRAQALQALLELRDPYLRRADGSIYGRRGGKR